MMETDLAFTRTTPYGSQAEPTYSGALSFLRRRYTKDLAGVDVAVVGVPFDLATTNRPGTRPGALKQMVALAEAESASVIAVQDVPPEQTASYGIVATRDFQGRHGEISAIVEKPRPEVAPSNLAVVGRYVLSGAIFDLLAKTRPGAGGEIQLTDGIAALMQRERVLAYRFQGRRFDCGSRIGLVEATIEFALDHDVLAEATRAYMREALAR